LKTRLLDLWKARAPLERALLAALAIVLVAGLYAWLVQSASQARSQLRGSVTLLRAQTVRLGQQAAEIERLRAAPPISVSQTDLRSLVQDQADAAGLSRALVRLEASDPNRVEAVFGAVAFADWLAWIDALKAQHTRLESCRIEALSTPGLVSVTATLVRAKLR
jgi:general secretion pathway protein M